MNISNKEKNKIAIIITKENKNIKLHDFLNKLKSYNKIISNSSKGVILSRNILDEEKTCLINFTTHSVVTIDKSIKTVNNFKNIFKNQDLDFYVNKPEYLIDSYPSLNQSNDDFTEYSYMLTDEINSDLISFINKNKEEFDIISGHVELRIIYKDKKVHLSAINNYSPSDSYIKWHKNMQALCHILGIKTMFCKIYKFENHLPQESI